MLPFSLGAAAFAPTIKPPAPTPEPPVVDSPPPPPSPPPPGYLTFPTEYVSKDGKLEIDLHLDTVPYESEQLKFIGRGYNGMRPGPLWRVKAGDEITVHLHNDLSDKDNMASYVTNDYHKPNTTNLHTHGLHVSSKDPGDNVLVEVPPGEKRTYKYELGKDHMAGNHWYHAHFHGSTTIQVSAGAAGMIIVDDAPGEVPDFVREMKEVPILLNPVPVHFFIWTEMQDRHNKDLMQFEFPAENMPSDDKPWPENLFTTAPPGRNRGCQVTGFDAFATSGHAGPPVGYIDADGNKVEGWVVPPLGPPWWDGSMGRGKGYIPPDESAFPGAGTGELAPLYPGWAPNIESCLLLVNGQELPKYKMQTGEWNRLRLTLGSALNYLYMFMDGVTTYDGTPVGSCEMNLLGKDGVYLPVSGREITRIVMPAGGRADVAIRCSKPGTYKLIGMDPNTLIATDHFPKAMYNGMLTAQGKTVADYESGWPGFEGIEYAGAMVNGYEGEIMHFEVEGEEMTDLEPFPKFKAARPCYLADLLEVPQEEVTEAALDFAHRARTATGYVTSPPYPASGGGQWELDPEKKDSVTYYNSFGLLGPGSNTINGLVWGMEGSKALAELEVGKVVELSLTGIAEHPAHIHVNSFQLMETPPGEYGGYMMAGDWHDTVQTMLSPWMGLNDEKTGPGNLQMGARTFTSITCIHPPYTRPAGWDTEYGCPDFELGVPYCADVCKAKGPNYAGAYTTPLGPAMKVRFQTDKFTGESVVHCHILLHEDLGMMGAMHISGEEGTVWPDAKKYEPTCSAGKYTMV